jgi:hypothetical protein
MLFVEELRDAFDQIRTAPRLGSAYEAVRGHEHRRVLMPDVAERQMLSWPSSSCTALSEAPRITRWLANVWRLLRARSKRHYPACRIIPRRLHAVPCPRALPHERPLAHAG